jgi:hypothetical protein
MKDLPDNIAALIYIIIFCSCILLACYLWYRVEAAEVYNDCIQYNGNEELCRPNW